MLTAEDGRCCRVWEIAVMSPRASEMHPTFFGLLDSSSIDVLKYMNLNLECVHDKHFCLTRITWRSSWQSFSPSGITHPNEFSALMTAAGLLGSVRIVVWVPLMQSRTVWREEIRLFFSVEPSCSCSHVRNWGLAAIAWSKAFTKQELPKLMRPKMK